MLILDKKDNKGTYLICQGDDKKFYYVSPNGKMKKMQCAIYRAQDIAKEKEEWSLIIDWKNV